MKTCDVINKCLRWRAVKAIQLIKLDGVYYRNPSNTFHLPIFRNL